MVIGEAPGANEDLTGDPFVGRSGKRLDELLYKVGLNPSNDVYITNVVKCRPPKNRRPSKEELKSCMPWLIKQIELVDPLIILLLGATALESILGKKGPMTKVRGKWYNFGDRLVMPLFHPSYLLRNPSAADGSPTSLTISDLEVVRNKLVTCNKAFPNSILDHHSL